MKKHSFYTSSIFAALTATLVLSACGSPSGGSNETSFDASAAQAELFADAGMEANQVPDANERSWRKRNVRVNFDALKQAAQTKTIRANLFDDEVVELQFEQVEAKTKNNFVAVGRIANDHDSAVTLVMNDGVLVANISKGEKEDIFEVRHLENGVHTVRLVQEGVETEDCDELEPEVHADGEEPLSALMTDDQINEQVLSPQAAQPVIDILGAYTPNARIKAGGTNAVIALIQLGIADTNRAFADSGINLAVRLVGTLETRQNETSSWSNDIAALRSKTDSRWNEVHTERAKLGADQVTLIGAYGTAPGTAGIGYMNATVASAFTIVRSNSFGQYTFSHELGHNLGLSHERGYQSSAGRFRTIMAYGSYTRVRRFSNPNRTYNGYRTGDSYRNSVAIVNKNATRAANLMNSIVPAASLAPLMVQSDQ